jgi:hypothetical protein
MAKIVVLAQADVPDDELKSLVDAGHEVTVLHPQKASVFALMKGLGGSLTDEEPEDSDTEEQEEPEDKKSKNTDEAPAEDEVPADVPEEVPDDAVTERYVQVLDVDVAAGRSKLVEQHVLYVPELNGRFFQLGDMEVSTALTRGQGRSASMTVKRGGRTELHEVLVVVDRGLTAPFFCIPA